MTPDTPDTINAERDADEVRNDPGNDTKATPPTVVPGLERGLKILTEFSPREPVARRTGIIASA